MQSAIDAAKTVPVSLEEAWSELERELSVRRRCYDNWITDGKLSWADARDRYARMHNAAKCLRSLIEDTSRQAQPASPP